MDREVPHDAHKHSHKARTRSHRDATRLTRKAGVYYYRRRMPGGLPGEIMVSLATNRFRHAEWLAVCLEARFRCLPWTAMTRDEIQSLLRGLLDKLLEEDEAARVDFKERGKPAYGSWRDIEDQDGDISAVEAATIQRDIQFWRDVQGEGDFSAVDETVDELLEGREVDEPTRRRVAAGVVDTFIKAREVSLGRATGAGFTVLDMPTGPIVPAQPIVLSPPLEKPKLKAPAQRASEMLPGFMGHIALNEVRGQTKAQTEASVKLFIKTVGDRPVDTYGLADGQTYWEVLRQLPSDHHKLGRGDEKRTIAEVIERGRQQKKGTLALRSLQRHKNVLEAFVAYVYRKLPDRVDPRVKEMTSEWRMPKKRVAAHEERDPWSSQDLQTLFGCPIWRGSKSEVRQLEPGPNVVRNWKFWLPLLSLYTGARLEELCQLRGEDIRHVNSVWCFEINDQDGRLVKNPQSVRWVPVHPELVRLGFLAHVRKVAPNADDRVFPTLKPMGPDNKLSYYPTRWFGDVRAKLGIAAGVGFHSFRHNVTSRLLNAEVPLVAVSRILGRTTEGGGETGNRYYRMERQQASEFISRLAYPEVNLSHLYLGEETCR